MLERSLRSWHGAVLALVALLWSASARAEPQPLSFGIVPQAASSRLAEQWVPLLNEVSQRAGVRIAFRTTKDIPTFEAELGAGAYDLAYMNPYHYSVFHRHSGYQAFAKEKDRRLIGILVVRVDSPYRTIGNLADKSVIFPAPAAFAASILTQAEFARQGVKITPRYVSSHDSVYRGVSTGNFAAGGGITRTLDALPAEQRAELRVLATTREYTPHPFAAHPRVSPELIARIMAAMRSLQDDEIGRRVLEGVAMKGIEAGLDQEWNDVRALDIHLLEQWQKQKAE
ncbi:Putative periplasmic binding protein-related protein [Magnetospirillum sp. XM-1]|uniref:phosphate/phosphite/phosphonate ABC transporter substrate-binding protein n=1 Tax=Magnetospirillum sp. XM-1 TaxID=1663591 RepID=UPI00073DCFCC|nr:phosphate/phosphite/phosphonate ABC transporter substrate-binding protein [Magnetospirillum sp. XM-1]CUW41226.1 Putative periplasmic binding protein-related protein [Magnetospirillum sp. XM-1]